MANCTETKDDKPFEQSQKNFCSESLSKSFCEVGTQTSTNISTKKYVLLPREIFYALMPKSQERYVDYLYSSFNEVGKCFGKEYIRDSVGIFMKNNEIFEDETGTRDRGFVENGVYDEDNDYTDVFTTILNAFSYNDDCVDLYKALRDSFDIYHNCHSYWREMIRDHAVWEDQYGPTYLDIIYFAKKFEIGNDTFYFKSRDNLGIEQYVGRMSRCWQY